MKKNKNQNVTPELGADKDGMKQGGIVVESTNPFESQTVEVKMPLGQPTINKVGGQKRMLASKKSSVKWY